MYDNFPSPEVSETQRQPKDAASPRAKTRHDWQQVTPVGGRNCYPWGAGVEWAVEVLLSVIAQPFGSTHGGRASR